MKDITVLFKNSDKVVRENFERELFWYDPIKQEMQVFNGGELAFEYREDEYLLKMGEAERNKRGINSTSRLLPKVKDLQLYVHKEQSNEKAIRKWYMDYLNYNNTKVAIESFSNKDIVFSVPDEEVDDFTYQLERNSFRYRS